jgi:predicted metalloprotease
MLGLLPLLTRTRYGWLIALVLIGLSVAGGLGGVFGGGGGEHAANAPQQGVKADDAKAKFVGFVLDDVQKTWRTKMPEYQSAKLVLFTGATDTGCGYGRAATGPFYCPQDGRVYIDLSFYDELERRLGAKGDFAQAYVIAHEIGHHVQNLLGTSDRVHAARKSEQVGAEGLSVRLELQADCYAGVWAHDSNRRELLEVGDVEEAMNAAAAIGDDRLQRSSTGAVHPERWTHGSSAQRARWFQRGFETGSPESCDTFGAGKI